MAKPGNKIKTKNKSMITVSRFFDSKDSKRLYFLNKLVHSVREESDLKGILKTVMLVLDMMYKPEAQIIHLIDNVTQKIESYYLVKKKKTEVSKSHFPIDEEAVRNLIQNAKTTTLTASKTEFDKKPKTLHLSKKGSKSVLMAALSSKGKPFGAIELVNKKLKGNFSEDDCKLIDSVKDFISIIIENRILHEKTLELSIIDYVSGLYNMKHFKNLLSIEIERANRTLKPFLLIFFDLDFFKKVNNTHGHLVGSSILRKIGDILRKHLRKTDISARLGGDEFIIILPNTTKSKGKLVAERLRKTISDTPFQVRRNLIINITGSFGIAAYPEHSSDPEVLIDLSDKAMYMAKKKGRNGVVVHPK